MKIGLTHLCFADDLIIFSNASPHSLRSSSVVLSEFYSLLGLLISYQKSELYCCKVLMDEQLSIANFLDMRLGTLPVSYLGVPLISGKLKNSDCQIHVNKITSRNNSWTSKFLSFAGRLQLIDSVINHTISYWLQIFILPKK